MTHTALTGATTTLQQVPDEASAAESAETMGLVVVAEVLVTAEGVEVTVVAAAVMAAVAAAVMAAAVRTAAGKKWGLPLPMALDAVLQPAPASVC